MKFAALNCALGLAALAQNTPSDGLEFFESKVRPVLAKNCYACHSAATKTPMAGLFLDTKQGVLKGGNSGPAVVPGKPEESLLIRAIHHDGRKMPPAGKLSDAVIADLEKWVSMGAPDPREGKTADWKQPSIDIEKGRQYWAFQPPVKPDVPKVKNRKWSSQPIDRLLLAAMEPKHLTPAADADRATWLRRVTFDLTGLPPAIDEIDAFLKDRGSKAWAKVVDRLLASPRFGERWGRHWLDVARYAESVGRGRNYAFPLAWKYRDYVIESFNKDKPYDRFVMEQIAGDLLPADDQRRRNEQLIATGFLALGSHDLIEINPATFRMDVIDEQINATTRSFMALTVGCARCHDHKFDPIPTTDYYAMAGIFRSTEMLSGLQRRPRDNVSYFNISLLSRLTPAPGEASQPHLDPEKLSKWEELNDTLAGLREGKVRGVRQRMQGPQLRLRSAQILRQLDQFPLPGDLAMGVRDASRPEDCEVHIRGDVQDLGPKVPRGFVQVASRAEETPAIEAGHSGRLELARWLARRDNPLTARAMVNRIWLHLFGRGIVPTVDNFGKMGEQPTHPQLLDYLAVRFIEQGWSAKKIIREIALSRAYRMSTTHNARNFKADPDNSLLWRMNRRRLEVEAIRDSLLAVAGRLDLQPPGASPVFSYKRGFDVGRGQGTIPQDYSLTSRYRSVYVPVLRNYVPAMFETFDFAEPSETKGRREVTTVPTQALFFMNSGFVLEQAKSAAAKLVESTSSSSDARVATAYRQVLARPPRADEIKQSLEFVGNDPAAWARLYQALFASAEFRYRN